ncbi:MAG: hypothetical protein Fur005_45470 [Roseiflexaceae bacterium]
MKLSPFQIVLIVLTAAIAQQDIQIAKRLIPQLTLLRQKANQRYAELTELLINTNEAILEHEWEAATVHLERARQHLNQGRY